MIKLNITYEKITPESAALGDFSDTGYYEEDLLFNDIRDAEEYIDSRYDIGCLEYSDSRTKNLGDCLKFETWATTIDPEIDYKTGEETRYSFHLSVIEITRSV